MGVERTAGESEIKKAYRKLAFENHPDRNPGDVEAEARFKEAAEAYEVLRDPQKRQRYDQFGHAGLGDNGFQGFHSADDVFGAFGDIFSEFFGFSSRRSANRPQAGADLRYNLEISFREAAKGAETTLNIPKNIACEECGGSGAEPGTSPETCQQCGGAGQVQQSQGFFRIAVTCPVCHGRGQIITHPCRKCRGRGQVQEVRDLSVRIPAGVDNGSRLRLRGEGEPGVNGGPPGDLYVVIHVQPDKIFERQGQDLIIRKEIDFVQAILGGAIEVETLDEPEEMEIPHGTQSGEVFRIPDKGLPYLGGSQTGDLLVEVTVKIPSSVNRKQEELLREFKRLEGEKPLNRVKNFFKGKKPSDNRKASSG